MPKNISKTDLNDFFNQDPSLKTGVRGLWIKIFTDCFFTIKEDRNQIEVEKALHFFDPDNLYFDAFCDELKIDPDDLRRRVLKALDCPDSTRLNRKH